MINSPHMLAISAMFCCALVNADSARATIGNAIVDVPLFDAHMHYQQPAWEPYPVATVLDLMNRSGVAMALVSSTPDEGTIRLWEYAPNRVVPELRPYRDDADRSNWTKSSAMLEYLQQRMRNYPHRGIGEFHIHQLDPSDRAFLRQVAALAVQHKAILHMHSGAGPVELLYELEPQLTVIWAHAGLSEPPDVIEPLLARYETLYADTSYRQNDIVAGDGLDPAWRALISTYPDRFLAGSDTWANAQWANYDDVIASNRNWLSYFPREIAEMIAFKNAEALFGIQVTRSLLGTR